MYLVSVFKIFMLMFVNKFLCSLYLLFKSVALSMEIFLFLLLYLLHTCKLHLFQARSLLDSKILRISNYKLLFYGIQINILLIIFHGFSLLRFFLSLNILLAAIMEPKLGDVEYEYFKLDLLKMVWYLWSRCKFYSMILKNNSRRFLTWKWNCGVNQIIFCFLVGLFLTFHFLWNRLWSYD